MGDTALLVVGMSHHRASVDWRERVAIPREDMPAVLRALRDTPGILEVVAISTCNRTELYAVTQAGHGPDGGAEPLLRFLADRAGATLADLRPVTYTLSDLTVARHLFRVASGLDSLVVGEVEILGQVKEALRAAQAAGSGGKWLYTLFRRAIEAGKRARTETAISAGAASVSWAAVELARERVPDLARAQVLVIGAGATGEAIARALADQGVEGTMVTNRTAERAERLAAAVHGAAVPFARFLSFLAVADVVICCTDAPHPLLTAASVRSIVPARRGRRLCIVDVAVPRDVEPEVGQVAGVELYDIDALATRADAGVRRRQAEVTRVDTIILEEVERFASWTASQRVTSTIATLQQRAEAVRQEELRRIATRLNGLSDEEQAVIEAATRAIVSKMLHHPISVLRETALQGGDLPYVQAVETLFDLPTERRR